MELETEALPKEHPSPPPSTPSENGLGRAPAPPPVSDDLLEIIIEPRPGWHFVDLRELVRYHELLFFLTWRDIKVRYKQTVLGAAWAILQPLTTMLVFTLFLARVTQEWGSRVPYPLFVFAGLLPWTFFANAISSAASSVVGNQNLVTKVYFPRLLIPMGAVLAGVVDFAIGFIILLILQAGYIAIGIPVKPGWSLALVPVTTFLLLVASLGVGTLLAALTVAYRDFRHIVPFLVQIWMFATPAVYLQAEGVVGPRGQWILPLNPAYGLIANFRLGMIGHAPDWYSLIVSSAASVLLLLLGAFYFRRVERHFADII